jgi:hypothetical protein
MQLTPVSELQVVCGEYSLGEVPEQLSREQTQATWSRLK